MMCKGTKKRRATNEVSNSAPAWMPGIPRGGAPRAAPKASAAPAHSRAWQDAKRRENMDAKRLTE